MRFTRDSMFQKGLKPEKVCRPASHVIAGNANSEPEQQHCHWPHHPTINFCGFYNQIVGFRDENSLFFRLFENRMLFSPLKAMLWRKENCEFFFGQISSKGAKRIEKVSNKVPKWKRPRSSCRWEGRELVSLLISSLTESQLYRLWHNLLNNIWD